MDKSRRRFEKQRRSGVRRSPSLPPPERETATGGEGSSEKKSAGIYKTVREMPRCKGKGERTKIGAKEEAVLIGSPFYQRVLFSCLN